MKSLKITKSITPRDTTSFVLYLKEVNKEDLISPEKEVELAERIHNGDESAVDELVRANLRFAITVAKQYQGRGLPLEDLIAEANIGLIKAAHKFDETKGFRFISYAIWWIRQSILKAIYYTGNNVRLPTSQIEPKNKLNKIIKEFEQNEGRKPSIDELVDLSGFTEEFIRDVNSSVNNCVSIDAPSIDESENCTIGDCIPDTRTESPIELTNNSVLSDQIEQILSTFSNRDHDIICMVFGLRGCPEMTYDEIAKKFCITSERVRQITQKLLKKFKTEYGDKFKELL